MPYIITVEMPYIITVEMPCKIILENVKYKIKITLENAIQDNIGKCHTE